MTELEQARAHLRMSQEALASIRRFVGRNSKSDFIDRVAIEIEMQDRTRTLYAALSWVADAQTRAGRDPMIIMEGEAALAAIVSAR